MNASCNSLLARQKTYPINQYWRISLWMQMQMQIKIPNGKAIQWSVEIASNLSRLLNDYQLKSFGNFVIIDLLIEFCLEYFHMCENIKSLNKVVYSYTNVVFQYQFISRYYFVAVAIMCVCVQCTLHNEIVCRTIRMNVRASLCKNGNCICFIVGEM